MKPLLEFPVEIGIIQMRDGVQLPDLKFSDIDFAEADTPWNMNVLLYKGGAKAPLKSVAKLIESGALGEPLHNRLSLVVKLRDEIQAGFSGGGSRVTAEDQFRILRYFFGFIDSVDYLLTLETATEAFVLWSDLLFYRTRWKEKSQEKMHDEYNSPLARSTAYFYCGTVGGLLNRVLDRHSGIMELTRLQHPGYRKTPNGIQAEKQNLSDTFIFGHLLQDICDGLSLTTFLENRFPFEIKSRSDKSLVHYVGKYVDRRNGDTLVAKRYSVANLRIEAELLMFIGQTGMNLAQTVHLELRHFFYVSHLDGYQVKEHKHRRGGIVLFEIFKDYKAHFERYLEWRRSLFPHSNLLFPFIKVRSKSLHSKFTTGRLRNVCSKLEIPLIGPRYLRNTRVNWLLRMTGDPSLTSEMAQHSTQTLLQVYERPSLQRAMTEATQFWSVLDPHLAKTEAVAPGDCTGVAKAVVELPNGSPQPDCVKASGCLWCENHRDVDSFDYVWALVSFKHLKTIELSKASLPKRDVDTPPAMYAIERIDQKLRWFEQASEERRMWVHEAQARRAEGEFHPGLRDEILELEGAI